MQMWTRLLTRIVCFTLAWATVVPAAAAPLPQQTNTDLTSLQSQYPHARIIHTDREGYTALQTQLHNRGYRPQAAQLLLAASTATGGGVDSLPDTGAPPPTHDECAEQAGGDGSGDDSLQIALDMTDDLFSDSNSDESAAVLFVIVGTVVLVVWTLYVVKYFYDLAMGQRPCGRWSEWVMSSSRIGQSPTQHARFDGLRYLTGFRDGGTDVGVSVELGQADILLTEVGSLSLQGVYWYIGPLLRWRFGEGGNPHYFQMEFLAGSTEHKEMGITAEVKMGLNFGIGERLRLGLGVGALNINLHENQGIISDRSQFYWLYGLEFGYRF